MRNWADLPDDLLNLILSKLFAKDRHMFSLVCRSWNTVAASSAYRYSPCLMYYHRSKHMWKLYQYNSFFYMSFTELEKAEICCSKYGWLLMRRYDNSLFFFDPFNNQRIEIPCKLRNGYSTVSFFHPPTSPDCFIVGIDDTPDSGTEVILKICVLKHGEKKWDINIYRPRKRFLVSRGAPVLHGGLLYFSDVRGNVATFNMSKCDDCKPRLAIKFRCLRRRRLGNKIKEHYLFKINGEEAMFVVFVLHEERKVSMFRLLEPEMKWEPMQDIGDKVLYLSHVSSFGNTAYLKNMSNRIYFPKFHGDTTVFYSLNSGKYHSVDGDYSNNNSYGLQRLDLATWITPAPTPEFLTELLTWCPEVD
ncbi:hypothetical protein DH2020_047496 [Rehmannia glutinosa]|uniref:F-box domain-containing protein n=1 Tax=Rehmannia glutinosa TaxID=99300 RepID=A0ABR0U999_REHGL